MNAEASLEGQRAFNTVARTANTMGQVQFRKERLRDETFLAEKSVDLRRQSNEVVDQWKQEFAEDPLGKVDVLNERLVEIEQQFVEEAPSDWAKEKVALTSERYFLNVQQSAKKWETAQVIAQSSMKADESLQKLQVETYRNPTPANLEVIEAEAEVVLSPLKGNVAPQVIEEMKNKFSHAATVSMFEGLVDNDQLQTAKKLIDSKEYDEKLGVNGIRRVEKAIATKKKFKARAKADLYNMRLTNPWKYLKKVGENIPPVNVNNLNSEQLYQRAQFVNDARQRHGVDVNFLSPQEEDFVVEALSKGQPQQTTQFFDAVQGLPDQQFETFAQQMMRREPVYGTVMGMQRGNTATSERDANMILQGMRLVGRNKESGKGIGTPSNANVMEAFDAHMGTALGDPSLRESVRQAAFYHYTQKMFNKGEIPQDLSEEDFKESVNTIVGNPVEFNDRKVLPFRKEDGNFVDEDEFENTIDRLNDDILEKTHKDVPRTFDGRPVNMEKSRNRLGLQNYREGQYFLFVDDRITLDKNGKAFILDMEKVHKAPKPEMKEILEKRRQRDTLEANRTGSGFR